MSHGMTIVVVGANGVGKSCFVGRFLEDELFPPVTHWIDSLRFRELKMSDGETWHVHMDDIVLKPMHDGDPNRAPNFLEQMLLSSYGFILLYDITDAKSYESVTTVDYETILALRNSPVNRDLSHGEQPCEEPHLQHFKRFGAVLVGNKLDLVSDGGETKRQVPKSLAEEWAAMRGMKHFEIDTSRQDTLEDVVRELVVLMQKAVWRDKEDMERGGQPYQEPDGLWKAIRKSVAAKLSTKGRKYGKKDKYFEKSKKEMEAPWSMFLSSAGPPELTGPPPNQLPPLS